MKLSFKEFLEEGRTFNSHSGKEVDPAKKAEPLGDASKFKVGSMATVKKTGDKVKIIGVRNNLVQTATDDATKVPTGHKGGVFAKGYKEYMPRELEECLDEKTTMRKIKE